MAAAPGPSPHADSRNSRRALSSKIFCRVLSDRHRLDGRNRLAVDAFTQLVVVGAVGREHHLVRRRRIRRRTSARRYSPGWRCRNRTTGSSRLARARERLPIVVIAHAPLVEVPGQLDALVEEGNQAAGVVRDDLSAFGKRSMHAAECEPGHRHWRFRTASRSSCRSGTSIFGSPA